MVPTHGFLVKSQPVGNVSPAFALKHEGELPGEVEISMPCTFKDGVFMLYNINGNEMQWTGAVDGVLTCDVSAGGIYTLKKGNMGFEDETVALSGTSDITTEDRKSTRLNSSH